MTKSDLKTGYIVTLRNGNDYVVILDSVSDLYKCDIIVNSKLNVWDVLSVYNEDLTNKEFKALDIIKVEIPYHPLAFQNVSYKNEKRKLLWERKEIDRLNNKEEQTKMTPQEAVKYWKSFLKEIHDIKTRNQFDEDLVQEMTNQKAATKLAISALEKQIPKQVKFSKCITCYSDTCEDCKDGVLDKCPTCNESLNNGSVEECDFCPYCGQSLDWSREWIE